MMDGLCRECGYGAGEGHADTCRATSVPSCDRAQPITLPRARLEAVLREAINYVGEHGFSPNREREAIARALAALEREAGEGT